MFGLFKEFIDVFLFYIELSRRAEWPRRLEESTGIRRLPLVAGLLVLSIAVLVRLLGGHDVVTIGISILAATMTFSMLERPARRDATDQEKLARRTESKSLLKFWTVFGALSALEGVMWPLFMWQPMLQIGKLVFLAWCLLPISRGARVYDTHLPRLTQSCAFIFDRIPSHFVLLRTATSVWQYAKLASSGRLLQELSSESAQHDDSGLVPLRASRPGLPDIGASTGISAIQACARAAIVDAYKASAPRESGNLLPAVLPPLNQDLGKNEDDDYELIAAGSL